MTERICATVARVVDDVASAMERRTVNGTLSAPGSHAFDAVRELRQRRREFAVRFEHRFHEVFERRLLDRDEASENGIRALPPGCRSVLLEIDRRMETLRRGGVTLRRNPIERGAVLEAFNAACRDVAAGEPVRRALLELFQRHVEAELPRVYGDINALLARQGIRGAGPGNREPEAGFQPFASFPARPPMPRSGVASATQPARDPEVLRLIGERLTSRPLPHFVRHFALDNWARVMTLIKMEKGKNSLEWGRAWKTLDDLAAGVKVFGDPARRRAVIWTLPGLVRRLKHGMRTVSIPLQEQVLFLKTLRAHQLRVLRQRSAVDSPSQAADPDGD
ncbi:MAG: DUF1631 family protein [Gammaproteobacteria bacterium]|nr:DUF1631 family protein [Gammaproteobacteria bacterium]